MNELGSTFRHLRVNNRLWNEESSTCKRKNGRDSGYTSKNWLPSDLRPPQMFLAWTSSFKWTTDRTPQYICWVPDLKRTKRYRAEEKIPEKLAPEEIAHQDIFINQEPYKRLRCFIELRVILCQISSVSGRLIPLRVIHAILLDTEKDYCLATLARYGAFKRGDDVLLNPSSAPPREMAMRTRFMCKHRPQEVTNTRLTFISAAHKKSLP